MTVESDFADAMREIYRRGKAEAGCNATYFLQIPSEHGALETAHRLIRTSQPSEGFTQLWERRRLALTVETQVLRPEFHDLFSREERDICGRRLGAYQTTMTIDGHRVDAAAGETMSAISA